MDKKTFGKLILGALALGAVTALSALAKSRDSEPQGQEPDFNDFEKGPGVYHINWVSNEHFSAEGMQKHLNSKEKK